MEDEDSDKGGAGHLLTAWLGELDTLKKVNREETELPSSPGPLSFPIISFI